MTTANTPTNRLHAFNPVDVELSGQRLIEASAGTGKTYTIAALYLRLIVESGLPVGRILVVTFTNAATAELADRIRNRLATARQAVEHCMDCTQIDDELLRQLAVRSTLTPDALSRRLENALRGFDEAAIFTIHGFCQRVLADRAFASGMAFTTELEVDPSDRLSEIVADFWRRHWYHAEPLWVDWVLKQGYNPEKLLNDVRPHLGKPYLQLRQAPATQDIPVLEQQFNTAYATLRTAWMNGREQVKQCLTEAIQQGVLKLNVYKIDQLPDWLEQLDDYLRSPQPNLGLPSKFECFTTKKLAASLKKGHEAPQHDCFEHCQALSQAQAELYAAFAARLYHLLADLLRYTDEQLSLRKQRDQKQSYDDLLLNLDRALDNPSLGPQLANAVRKRYPAALIDEFQDTDPLQYGIFQRIYADSECPVFLVGDPKQAIYSFRGADIFAYLHAHHKAREQLTLTHNWRSTPELITAVNTLFSQHSAPFLLPDISFYPVSAADKADTQRLQIANDPAPPLRLWCLHDASDKRGVLNKGQATPWMAEACAAEIARLLNLAAAGQACLGDKRLQGGDIAVLVRKHDEGEQIRQALLALGVPSVQRSRDNVFATPEAEQLHHLLVAILNPAREGWVRAALVTELLGFDAQALLACENTESAWEQQLDHCLSLQHTWQQRGFAPLFRQLLSRWAIPQRLLGLDDGERRLTNLLHLGELLGAAALRERLLPETLLNWLARRRQMAANEVEEQQLRLESDEQLVQIVTLHKSKGLQYPIVFYPFGWSSGRGIEKNAAVPFHDPDAAYQAVLDLGSEHYQRARELAERERLAENLRLLYVGLTRAQQRCYLGWGLINEAEDSALAWLLHQPAHLSPDSDPFVAVQAHYKKLHATTLRQQLDALAEQAPDCIQVSEPPALPGHRYRSTATEGQVLRSRQFTGSLAGQWRISSFTTLTRQISRADQPLLPVERPDHDALADTTDPDQPTPQRSDQEWDVADFPRGARAGSCWHEIFELIDFTRSSVADCSALIERVLQRYGFAAEWTPSVAALVERVVQTPLDGQSLRLCHIPKAQRLDELEFHYPVSTRHTDLPALLLQRTDWHPAIQEHISRLDLTVSAGYMKGFIDLVFEADGRYYLLDYKSNWLGQRIDDYHPDALASTMADSAYYVQYLIYTVALHRYLRLRVPDYQYTHHFGGVFYLFLRGMEPDHPHLGVYADCPPQELLEALDITL